MVITSLAPLGEGDSIIQYLIQKLYWKKKKWSPNNAEKNKCKKK
jgi:hypothetical protein